MGTCARGRFSVCAWRCLGLNRLGIRDPKGEDRKTLSPMSKSTAAQPTPLGS